MQIKSDGTIVGLAVGGLPAGSVLPEDIAAEYQYNAIGSDVAMPVVGTEYDGPSLTLPAGKWFVTGKVTVLDGAAGTFACRLREGATVHDGAVTTTGSAGFTAVLPVNATIVLAATTLIRITVANVNNTTGSIVAGTSGATKCSSLTAVRIG